MVFRVYDAPTGGKAQLLNPKGSTWVSTEPPIPLPWRLRSAVKTDWNKGTRLAVGLVDEDVAAAARPAQAVFDEQLSRWLPGGAREVKVANEAIEWILTGVPWR